MRIPTHQHSESAQDLVKIFNTIQNIDIKEISSDEREKISNLYTDLADSYDLTNPTPVKAFYAFRKTFLCYEGVTSLSSNQTLEMAPPSLRSSIPLQLAEQELSSWEQSEDQNKKEACRLIKTAQGLPSNGVLDLSNLILKTLPSILFTDPRFVDIPIKVNKSEIRYLPPSLTLGSLLNVRLYEQCLHSLVDLAKMGPLGKAGPLPYILSCLPPKDKKILGETSKDFSSILQEYSSGIITIDSQEKLRSFLLDLERSVRVWSSVIDLSIKHPRENGECTFSNEQLSLIVRKCPNLQKLCLEECFEITDLQPLAALTGLQYLYLSECERITDLQPLAELTNLQHLYVNGCIDLTDLQPLKGLTDLQYLYLNGCINLTDLQPLANLTNLQHLYLCGCENITDLQPLAGLIDLQQLGLDGGENITDADLQHLARLVNLIYLDLNACKKITDAGLQHLVLLTNLQQLDLSWCRRTTEDGIENLRNQLLQAGANEDLSIVSLQIT